MFTTYTLTDWKNNPNTDFLKKAIQAYKDSSDFAEARRATAYYTCDGTKVQGKEIIKANKITTQDGEKDVFNEAVIGNRIVSDFFYIFVAQEASFLLGNGVTLGKDTDKKKLGPAFDTRLAQIGEMALVQAVCWGFWNVDHLEEIDAYSDDRSGAFAFVDEMTGDPGTLVQFWQISDDRPQYIRLFEPDGFTIFENDNETVRVYQEKQSYIRTVAKDAIGERVIGEKNYENGVLPIVPLYADRNKRSRLKNSILTKIDLYDNIISDFGDNLDQANDIYWVLNNYGGGDKEIEKTLQRIKELKAIVSIADGMNNSTAEPHTFEVPYQARKEALDIIKAQLYKDAMALDMDALTGGSLTNVAIEAAMTNLNLKCDRFEWQVFQFVQNILRLQGIETEEINFTRREIVNQTEKITAIYQMRADIDRRTALKLNPYINPDEIDTIIENLDAEETSGMPTMQDLQDQIDKEEEQNPEE